VTRSVVDAAAQATFVALSGDANPLHADPLAARRLPFGRVAVHGAHLALLAVDAWAAVSGGTPVRVRATFRHPVGVGDPIDVEVSPSDATVRLRVSGRLVADVQVEAGTVAPIDLLPTPPPGDPDERSWGDLAGLTGSTPLVGDPATIGSRFPYVPPRTVAALLAMTRVVGMHAPGLHSMLSSFDVSVAGDEPELGYRVESLDDRFSKVVLRVDGAATGTVVAFVRPAPVDPVVDTGAVAPGEFEGVRALVVGGSRGLGAVAVQLLAAGGADVRFTFHRGGDDAALVAAHAPGATAHRLDVDDVTGGLAGVVADGWRPTLLAWFASPPIFVGARGAWSDELHERFHHVYVETFLTAVATLGTDSGLAILWPSSVAVEADVPGMAEYADAKRAGEAACDDLLERHPGLRIDRPRFPRLRTDQTASFVPVDVEEPAPHVLAALRRLAPWAVGAGG
jgi:hypothetical protein